MKSPAHAVADEITKRLDQLGKNPAALPDYFDLKKAKAEWQTIAPHWPAGKLTSERLVIEKQLRHICQKIRLLWLFLRDANTAPVELTWNKRISTAENFTQIFRHLNLLSDVEMQELKNFENETRASIAEKHAKWQQLVEQENFAEEKLSENSKHARQLLRVLRDIS